MEKLPPQLPYYILMLAAFLTAFGAAVGAATGARPRWFFLHAAGLGLAGVGLALATVAAGPAPQLATAELRTVREWLFLVGGAIWLAWSVLYNLHIVRVTPRRDGQNGR